MFMWKENLLKWTAVLTVEFYKLVLSLKTNNNKNIPLTRTFSLSQAAVKCISPFEHLQLFSPKAMDNIKRPLKNVFTSYESE